jgi:hypothetical protein
VRGEAIGEVIGEVIGSCIGSSGFKPSAQRQR